MAEKNIKEEEINLEDEKYQEKYDEKTFSYFCSVWKFCDALGTDNN